MVDGVDAGEDHEPDGGDAESAGEMGGAVAQVVGGEGDGDDEEGADDVGGHGVQVRLYGAVAELGDDLGEEVGDGEEGHADAESDRHVDGPEVVFFEYSHCLAEREFGVDD